MIFIYICSLLITILLFIPNNGYAEGGDCIRVSQFNCSDSTSLKVSIWEDTLFSTKKITHYSFIAKRARTSAGKYRMRFTTDVYDFSDSVKAENRLINILRKPPNLLPEENKTWPLQRSFRKKSRVFVLKTDAAMFENTLDSLYLIQRDQCQK